MTPIRLGILSTAHINRLVIPGAHASDKVELVAVASERARRGRSGVYDVTVRRAGDDSVIAEFRGRSRSTGRKNPGAQSDS